MARYDKIIIGAGIYGLYAALFSARKGEKVCVLEHDEAVFLRSTYINQARAHNGYHYPRSFSTAVKLAKYYDRFCRDFDFAIFRDFEKIYATSTNYSWTDAGQFRDFCRKVDIRCDEINLLRFFESGLCDGAFLADEYTFDAALVRDYFLEELQSHSSVEIRCNFRLRGIENDGACYTVLPENGERLQSSFVLNATYAGINQIHEYLGFEKFDVKYEICEVILCRVSNDLLNVGLTVMDGPFFSIMPFGKTGLHSLTSVVFTPHMTSFSMLPEFECQRNEYCSSRQLANCNSCGSRPQSSWSYMYHMTRKYLKDRIDIYYERSLFAIKTVLKASEMDDSRPTIIRKMSENPTFVSVLSGKINTIYDLDEVL